MNYKKINNYLIKTLGIIGIVLFFNACGTKQEVNLIDLSGSWELKLDSLNVGEKENWAKVWENAQAVSLPGTLDEAGIGVADTMKPALNNRILSSLIRKHQYIGKAWYQKTIDIPADWDKSDIKLSLERVLWQSTVFVNGEKVGSNESLIGKHVYLLTKYVHTGKNTLTIRIDNSDLYPEINVIGEKYPIKENQEMAHAYTNHTQIKWNGILGAITLEKQSLNSIESLNVFSDVENAKINVVVNNNGEQPDKVKATIKDKEGNKLVEKEITAVSKKGNTFEFSINAPNLEVWDEFNPQLYTFEVTVGEEKANTTFGYRSFQAKDGHFNLNGNRIFLRGNLECVIFPLTGRPPMNKEQWIVLYNKAKEYGLNHFRFHSWCPPAAAFEAADEVGFYLQVELPHWSLKVGHDKKTFAFLESEADKILADYGQHPSFILMSMGNELEGDFDLLNQLTTRLKRKDSRHLYTTTTFSFQNPVGTRPEPADEFFVTQWTDKGWVRGQGVFNDYSPSFDNDYTQSSSHINVPLVSHEIGQYSVYPDVSEIEKYTGVLTPSNFIAVKNDLEAKGLLPLAKDFTLASGKLAAMLYKEEIERGMKTPKFDGFQLLQLQDFPGQGTALVGILNAFWESKGAITGEEFRQFNSELVPLARFKKAIYTNGESFEAAIEVANFYKPLANQTIKAALVNKNDEVVTEVVLKDVNLAIGNNTELGKLVYNKEVNKAEVLQLEITLEGTDYKNSWPVWFYPNTSVKPNADVHITSSFKEAEKWLAQGKKVLLTPNVKDIAGIEGRFVPVFWSPVHFPDQPGTMGLLIDETHKALGEFPTENYTQWQWWDLCKSSKSVKIDGFNLEPIVRVIDNFVTNNSLANLFEARVGNGYLVFSAIDLHTEIENRPAAKQLKNSILTYMNSEDFNPTANLSLDSLRQLKK